MNNQSQPQPVDPDMLLLFLGSFFEDLHVSPLAPLEFFVGPIAASVAPSLERIFANRLLIPFDAKAGPSRNDFAFGRRQRLR
jgi:hypothetical protein